MSNPDRLIDKTHLSIDQAEARGLIHRDYIAHCFRWTHVVKFLNKAHRYKDAIMLDVGCGKEVPLAKTMYVNKMTPLQYVGVDANAFEVPKMLQGTKVNYRIWAETDFCTMLPQNVCLQSRSQVPPDEIAYSLEILPNIFTSFEVLEHVTPEHCRRMLIHAQALTSPDCNYFISTPCYNGSAAGNHINEMTFAALGGLIEDLGFEIVSVHGTFASISDYEGELNDVSVMNRNTGEIMSRTDLTHVFNALRNYYDTNILAVMFAPLFPAKSRNCLWHLVKKDSRKNVQRKFAPLAEAPAPWSQHPKWKELDGQKEA